MIDHTKIVITSEMLDLISQIDQFKSSWKHLRQFTPQKLQALRKVATIESIGSSTRIEGVQLSDLEIEKLLSNVQNYSFVSRDEQEVLGYAMVHEEVFTSFESMEFSENLIKQLHQMLLKHSDKDQRHRGSYKTLPNHVEAFDVQGKSLGIVFKTATPFETPMRMQDLVDWVNQQRKEKTLHPLLIIGIFIVIFLEIHPFQDGNGRLSRILTTLLLLQAGYSYIPYSSLESFIERSKEQYYLALRKTQATLQSSKPDFIPWFMFFLKMLQRQKMHLEQKITKELQEVKSLPKLSNQILQLLEEHGQLGISDLQTLIGANRNTLKKHLANLVEDKMIVLRGQGKSAFYSLS